MNWSKTEQCVKIMLKNIFLMAKNDTPLRQKCRERGSGVFRLYVPELI